MHEGQAAVVMFGTSISSAYLSGATLLFRSLVSAFVRAGWSVTFVEEAHEWLATHTDYVSPPGLTVRRYGDRCSLVSILDDEDLLARADLVLKFSGSSIGHDRFLDEWLAAEKDASTARWFLVYVDPDAPMRLPYICGHPQFYLRRIMEYFDAVCVMLGGLRAVEEYRALGARHAFSLPAAIDVELFTASATSCEISADLLFVGNPTLGRQRGLQRLFFDVAQACPELRFVLAGAEWDQVLLLRNLRVIGYVPSDQLASLYRSARLVLNVTREEMAAYGDAGSLRLFEAAACGACIVSDDWPGLGGLFALGDEILIAKDTADVVESLRVVDLDSARDIGA